MSSTVLLPLWNPCWFSVKPVSSLSSIVILSLLSMIFSNNFPIQSKRHRGLYDDGSLGDLSPFFYQNQLDSLPFLGEVSFCHTSIKQVEYSYGPCTDYSFQCIVRYTFLAWCCVILYLACNRHQFFCYYCWDAFNVHRTAGGRLDWARRKKAIYYGLWSILLVKAYCREGGCKFLHYHFV